MTTSRQRKKQKSGHSGSTRSKKAIQKRLKRAPEIKGPAAIRENWDKNLTVRQNYRNLGLVGDLSLRDSGGAEKTHSLSKVGREKNGERPKVVSSSMATIERDEDGNVVSIQENTKQRSQTVWGPALNSDDEEEEEEEEDVEDDDEVVNEKAAEIISTLEEAAKTIQPVQRFTSTRENDWLTQMVIKHGQDVEAMSKDSKVNIWQKTQGEIKKAIKKAGGFEAIIG